MNEFWSKIIELAITLVVTGLMLYVTKVLLPKISDYIAEKKEAVKEEIGEKKYYKIEDFATQIVNAAEQKFKESKMGDKKKELAVKAISTFADKIGFDITEDEIDTFIESAVKIMNDAKEVKELIEKE